MKRGRTLVMGDLHGGFRALEQCLARCAFDPEADRLIQLGDLCDGWPEVGRCIDLLAGLPRFDLIVGNHDHWALQWGKTGWAPDDWLLQGGSNTVASYPDGRMPEAHVRFLEAGHPWLEEEGRVFVHAGLDPEKPMADQDIDVLMWDRELVRNAQAAHAAGTPGTFTLPFDEVYIGHTPTRYVGGGMAPLQLANLWMLDTDAGMFGKLTVMDVRTKEHWQSDLVRTLYPGVCPREAARARWESQTRASEA